MDATHPAPHVPFGRVPPLVGTVLAWSGAVAYPVVLHVVALNVPAGEPVPSPPPAGPTSRLDAGVQLADPVLPVLLPVIVSGLLVGLLRRRPLLALALLLVGSFHVAVTAPRLESQYLLFLLADLVVAYLVASWPAGVATAAAGMAAVGQLAAATYHHANVGLPGPFAFVVLALVTAGTIGFTIRERREHAAVLRGQAAAQAVTAERLRIARELHDMVAHSIGLIAIQAGVGARVIDTQPAEARTALATIEATSRETLAGLRRTLGALRRPDAEPAPLDPTPGLADLDRLVASAGDAGVRVELRWRGARRPLPADLDLAVFRIVQESVTNVVRHAGTDSCRVTVEQSSDEVVVEVVDEGRGCPVGGTGYGIVGMRERAQLLGGRFHAGPRPEGGFRVAARLPVPAVAP
ncbi:sensor histidine kinase [Micromonospora sp. DT47]|uniref:sensor histidine kinase n=1 Tax=Micromonospora sp. DT47 TaxID=3393431 RepID=UPI003CF95D47